MQRGTPAKRKEMFVVTWKNQKNHTELFDDLEIFGASYPRFDLSQIAESFAFSKTVFDHEEVRIEKRTIISEPKPDLPRVFFWDFNYDRIDWLASRATVIQRIIERGTTEHWTELKRFYGQQDIFFSLKEEVTYLPDKCMDNASSFFNIEKEEMLCYKKKLSLQKHWH